MLKTEADSTHRLSNIHILIVEGDIRMSGLLRSILTTLGFPNTNIVCAATEEYAWTVLSEQPFDIILCDWRQYGLNGIELTRRIRASDEAFRDMPVLMITGHAESADVQRARDAGITEFLVKPFTVQALCARLKEIVEKPRTFVIAPNFVGPDRRRRDGDSKAERRKRRTPSQPKR